MSNSKHESYELLNLIGYGLAKFNRRFVRKFGFKTKTAFYHHIVQLGIAETTGTVKNRQDLFDPFFDNGRKGWWQKGDAYIHRKLLIDSLYGALDVQQFVEMVKLYIESEFGSVSVDAKLISPVMRSKYKQLQMTGQEAEVYFINNYQIISTFEKGTLEDARLYGDGYDFQIQVSNKYYLVEIKGIRTSYGSIRLTKNEHLKANEYKNDYVIVIVSNLEETPKMTTIFNPIDNLRLSQQIVIRSQITYHSEAKIW